MNHPQNPVPDRGTLGQEDRSALLQRFLRLIARQVVRRLLRVHTPESNQQPDVTACRSAAGGRR